MALFSRKKKQKERQAKAEEGVKQTVLSDGADPFADEVPETREAEIRLQVKRALVQEQPELDIKSRRFNRIVKERTKERLVLRESKIDAIKPVGNIKFNSTDIEVDGGYASILTFVTKPGSMVDLRPLWGIDLIPTITALDGDRHLASRVSAKMYMGISRRPTKWAEDKITTAIEAAMSGYQDTTENRQAVQARRFQQQLEDTNMTAHELVNNASYLDLSIRIVVKAQSREDLNRAVDALRKSYSSKFNTNVSLAPFIGEQHVDYRAMLDSAEFQLGENYQMTSTEKAGSYPFITRGINDPDGVYVGTLAGEINSDPVLLNTLRFDDLAVVSAPGRAEDISSARGEMKHGFKAISGWGAQYTQDALMRGNRVVQFVLNGEDPRMVEQNVDLREESLFFNVASGGGGSSAGVNMLQSFDTANELQAFTSLIKKIQTVVSQMAEALSEHDDSQFKHADMMMLSKMLEAFFISKGLWVSDAKSNLDDVRLLNLPNAQVPKLAELIPHAVEFQNQVNLGVRDGRNAQVDVESVNKIVNTLQEMSNNYGYLFDRRTSINSDAVQDKRNVVYSFGSLHISNKRALLSQFVNVFEFGIRTLGEGDVLIINGADAFNLPVSEYLNDRFEELYSRGVKIVLLYERSNVLLGKGPAYKFHNAWFERASSRLTGQMTASALSQYEALLGNQSLPTNVAQALSGNQRYIYFLNRGYDTNLFAWDIDL